MRLIILAILFLLTACTPPNADAKGCTVSGCSGELCVAMLSDVGSICEYRDEYACYKTHGRCEKQGNGECGWTPTETLGQCIWNAQQKAMPRGLR